MAVWAVYLTVIFIWSTTPLAIFWSSEGLGSMAGLSLRILVSLLIVAVIRALSKRPRMDYRQNWKAYVAGAMGLFPAMALVYWSASYLPSSLISVLFGLAPFVIVLINLFVSSSVGVSLGQLIGMLLAFAGLAVFMMPGEDVSAVSVIGVLLGLGAAVFYAISTYLVKKYAGQVDITNQLYGTLLFVAPVLAIAFFFEGFGFRESMTNKGLYATLYLAAIGSVLGFLAYFYLLQKISVEAVSLIPMITPVIAVVLGVWLNAEQLSLYAYIGIGCILLGLWLFRFCAAQGASFPIYED